MRPRYLELYLEELVLHGFAPGDRYRISAAVQCELTRLFSEQGVPSSLAQGEEVAPLNGGVFFKVVLSSEAGVVGTQVAQSVYQGLSR